MLARKPFYFLRHGQTDWNAERLIQGQTNIPLNATGIHQAGEAKAQLAGVPITTICCSPLDRALRTAEIVNEALKSRLVIIDDLQECFFGEGEGKPVVTTSYEDLIRSAGSFGGESFETFVDRVIAGINKALAHPGPVLIVSHGGAFRAMQSRARLDHGDDMPNCVPVYLRPPCGENPDWKMEKMPGRRNG